MAELPEATENESWSLVDGAVYEENIFTAPKIKAKFFNKRVTFEIPMSFTERQVKSSFSNATQLNGFMSMIYNAIDKSMTIKLDALIMQTINSMIGETIHADFGSALLSSKSGVKAVNLLYKYNTKFSKNLTADKAIVDPEFIRYASREMGLYADRMRRISKLFNIEGNDRFTPADRLHVVMLSDFTTAANSYLQSDTFHDEFTRLPKAEIVPYWQGSGTGYDFSDVSKIDIVTPSGDSIQASGILGVMFDHDALGVANLDRRVTSKFNAKGEFWNNWYKADSGYFADFGENFICFFVA